MSSARLPSNHAASAFLSHAVVPQAREQAVDAARVAELGLGRYLDNRTHTHPDLHQHIIIGLQ